MRGKCEEAFALVHRAKSVLIGIERDFGVNDQRLSAGNIDDDIGTEATALAFDIHFGLKVSMFGEAAAFEDVLQLLLAPATARFWRIAQRVDEFCRFG